MFWAAVGKLANVMRNAVICVEAFLTTFEAGCGYLQPSRGPLAKARLRTRSQKRDQGSSVIGVRAALSSGVERAVLG